MVHGRKSSGDLSSSDEDGSPPGEQPPSARPTKALLERCAPASSTSSAPVKEEKEGVFEIRDFTTASSFERIAHQITLAAKKWAGHLKSQAADDGSQLLREEFVHMDFKYEILFQLLQRDTLALPSTSPASAERLGLQSLPARSHRLSRWFGVHHFVTVSVRGQNIDLDSARTVLSAMVLAAQTVAPMLPHPLSCFVPVEGGRGRRYLGELVAGGRRTLFTTDLATSVRPNLEHLEGLSEFFSQKLGLDAGDVPMAGVRFTYLADAFDPMNWVATSKQAALGTTAPVPEGATLDRDESDPVDTMQLHCVWPSFPQGSFVDSAGFTELDPKLAPYWKLRVLRADNAPLPLTKLLRNLLEFRKEARAVRSAEHSVQAQVPKTALASLTNAIQESLESILMPTPGEMQEQVEACLALPIVAEMYLDGLQAPEVAGLRGGLIGTRLAKFAELSSKMRCFKGSVTLWCQVLARMRQQWETLAPHLPSEAAVVTRRVSPRGVRTEFFDPAACLVQQKFEILQLCAKTLMSRTTTTEARPCPEGLLLKATGASTVAPALLLPALMTEDMLIQQDMAVASIADPVERAELQAKELLSDASAFKAANPAAEFEDFASWRIEAEHLSLEPFPREWLEKLWQQAPAQPAAEQQTQLFEPEREAEMALHYLENIDGTQLLLQIFRVQLRVTLHNLAALAGSESAHLRMLKDRALAASTTAFTASSGEHPEAGAEEEVDVDAAAAASGDTAEFPHERALQAALAATEALEAAVRLAASLRAKLPGPGEALLEELLAEGEAGLTSESQRHAVEVLFERGRVLAQGQGREPLDGKGVFESLPMAKEFVLQLQPSESSPAAGLWRRLYAEVREQHLRLAISKSFPMT